MIKRYFFFLLYSFFYVSRLIQLHEKVFVFIVLKMNSLGREIFFYSTPFFLLLSSPLQVVATDYESYSCVHSCLAMMGFRAAFSWVLSRQPTLDPSLISYCRDRLHEYEIDTTAMQPVIQGKVSASNTWSKRICSVYTNYPNIRSFSLLNRHRKLI